MPGAPTSTHALAEELADFTVAQLTALAEGPLPELRLPRVLLGQAVGPDVRADLLFTLGLLHACGRTEVAGLDVEEAVRRLLAEVDGPRTHTFYSYRVAETVARFGDFATSTVLAPLSARQRSAVAEAVDSTAWLAALDDGRLPRNYCAVLARCEQARLRLGLVAPNDEGLVSLLARVRDVLGGFLDDSNAGVGRYDIYTVDIHLFCEPMAAELAERWRTGAAAAIDLVDRVATRDGAAVPWGRSTGVLAVCHTVELAGLVARHPSIADEALTARTLARAAAAGEALPSWFRDGWVTAHQHRSSDPYRGLDRRLQMTLDCLGKLADTAVALRSAAALDVDRSVDLFPPRNEVVWLDRSRHAGVWAFRDAGTAFCLPLVGGTTSDYLPAPRNSSLHEAPVGGALASGVPVLLAAGKRYAGGGLPSEVTHDAGVVSARYDGFPEVGRLEPDAGVAPFGGSRHVTWTVDGRTLRVEEHLRFDETPEGIGLQVTEALERPLAVAFDADVPFSVASLDTDGIAEYRSAWGPLPRTHSIDVEPARTVHLRWSVTPLLRTVSTAAGHHYNDHLYAPLADRVRVARLPRSAATEPGARDALAARTDQFHLHWPEWLLIGPLERHLELIEGLRRRGVRIVWTQHNLVPHTKDPSMAPVYGAWASAADLVIHHSRWGMDRARATYGYGSSTRHVVIPHGHFGPPSTTDPTPVGRRGPIRLGIVGAPRVEKDVELVMRAVARCRRPDIELVVHSLAGDEHVPADPRIRAVTYEMVPREEYDRVLRTLDALVMPFDPDGEMLTTGTTGDAVGFGLPAIASSWGYLREALGAGAIVYGCTEDDLVSCLEALTRDDLSRAAAAARALRPVHDWRTVAERTYDELDRLGSTHH